MILFITSRRGLQEHTLLQWHSSYDILLTIGRENRVCSFSQGPGFKTRSFVNETCFLCMCQTSLTQNLSILCRKKCEELFSFSAKAPYIL